MASVKKWLLILLLAGVCFGNGCTIKSTNTTYKMGEKDMEKLADIVAQRVVELQNEQAQQQESESDMVVIRSGSEK